MSIGDAIVYIFCMICLSLGLTLLVGSDDEVKNDEVKEKIVYKTECHGVH